MVLSLSLLTTAFGGLLQNQILFLLSFAIYTTNPFTVVKGLILNTLASLFAVSRISPIDDSLREG